MCFSWLCRQFDAEADFKGLSHETFACHPLADARLPFVQRLLDDRAETPASTAEGRASFCFECLLLHRLGCHAGAGGGEPSSVAEAVVNELSAELGLQDEVPAQRDQKEALDVKCRALLQREAERRGAAASAAAATPAMASHAPAAPPSARAPAREEPNGDQQGPAPGRKAKKRFAACTRVRVLKLNADFITASQQVDLPAALAEMHEGLKITGTTTTKGPRRQPAAKEELLVHFSHECGFAVKSHAAPSGNDNTKRCVVRQGAAAQTTAVASRTHQDFAVKAGMSTATQVCTSCSMVSTAIDI